MPTHERTSDVAVASGRDELGIGHILYNHGWLAASQTAAEMIGACMVDWSVAQDGAFLTSTSPVTA